MPPTWRLERESEEVWPQAVERTRDSVMEWLAAREEETG